MKPFRWNHNKNDVLKIERGISFEVIALAIGRSILPRLGVAKAESHLTVVTSDDILFPHHLKEFERSIPLISVDQA